MSKVSAGTKGKTVHRELEKSLWDGGVREAISSKLEMVQGAVEEATGRLLALNAELTDDGYRVWLGEPDGHRGDRREIVLQATMCDSMEYEGSTAGFSIKVCMDGFDPARIEDEDGGWMHDMANQSPKNFSRSLWTTEKPELLERINDLIDWGAFAQVAVDHLKGGG